jgi:hypothetical protein
MPSETSASIGSHRVLTPEASHQSIKPVCPACSTLLSHSPCSTSCASRFAWFRTAGRPGLRCSPTWVRSRGCGSRAIRTGRLFPGHHREVDLDPSPPGPTEGDTGSRAFHSSPPSSLDQASMPRRSAPAGKLRPQSVMRRAPLSGRYGDSRTAAWSFPLTPMKHFEISGPRVTGLPAIGQVEASSDSP